MTTIPLHAAPRWRDVALEQIRAVGLKARAAGGLLLGALLLYGGVSIMVIRRIRETHPDRPDMIPDFSFTPGVAALIAVVALILPPLMWDGETPTRRTYHVAMPVPRSRHALTRAFAGWVWLMAATALFVALITIVGSVTQTIGGRASGLTSHLWEWCVPFTAVTIAYVVASAAAIGAQSPTVWIIGPFALWMGGAMLLALMGFATAARRMTLVMTGRFGLGTAVGGLVYEPGGSSMSRWLGATLLWAAVSAVLLIGVSLRRTDSR